jgi:hypothetical protein
MSSDTINADQLYSPRQVAKLENTCVATIYVRMARGEYSVFKDGRKTAITGSSILERRRNKLTPATFKAPPPPPPARFHTINRSA